MEIRSRRVLAGICRCCSLRTSEMPMSLTRFKIWEQKTKASMLKSKKRDFRNHLPKIAVEYSDGGNDCPAHWKQVHYHHTRQKHARVFFEACCDTKPQARDQEEKTSVGLRVLDNGQQRYYRQYAEHSPDKQCRSKCEACATNSHDSKWRSSNSCSDSVNGFSFTWNARRTGRKAGVAWKNMSRGRLKENERCNAWTLQGKGMLWPNACLRAEAEVKVTNHERARE